jgi:hypothetical protein
VALLVQLRDLAEHNGTQAKFERGCFRFGSNMPGAPV